MLSKAFPIARPRFGFFFAPFFAALFTLACIPAPAHASGQDAAQGPQAAPASSADSTAQPDSAQVPPPAPAAFQNLIPSDQLAFLKDYDGKTSKEIMKDKRFHALIKEAIPRTEYHYGSDKSLSDASEELLATVPLPINVRDGRYVTISTRGGSYLAGKTLLWFDMQSGAALGTIYFHPSNGEPTPTLTVFSKQLTDTSLSMGQLPSEFVEDLGHWEDTTSIAAITPRYFIPANGKKYVLVHDEDYCWHPDNDPPPEGCEAMNANAADDDMNAAYFMQETHNAANATAWMLEPDQIEWLAVRDRTCMGPNALACRVRVTHERTSVLIGHPVPRLHPVSAPHPVHR